MIPREGSREWWCRLHRVTHGRELLEAGHDVVIVDDFSNAVPAVLERINRLAGREVPFDLLDRDAIDAVFAAHDIDAVIHFAGSRRSARSRAAAALLRQQPRPNADLLAVMQERGVDQLVFSSSATVYGDPTRWCRSPRTRRCGATNPYGRTKLMHRGDPARPRRAPRPWRIVAAALLQPRRRPSQRPHRRGPGRASPTTSCPTCAGRGRQAGAADRLRRRLPDPDGTGVRDYIHVVDLAHGHLAALERLAAAPRLQRRNLGTGRGYSVLEMVQRLERPWAAAPLRGRRPTPRRRRRQLRRPALARELGWRRGLDLEAMCADAWRWQSGNPTGYSD